MRREVRASGCTILYFIRPHLAFIVFIMFSIIMLLVDPLPYKHIRPETVVDICFLPPQRMTVNTGKGSLFHLDRLKILLSNALSL